MPLDTIVGQAVALPDGKTLVTGYLGQISRLNAEGSQDAVGGGGRYDDLVRALGGRESVPACGFSFGLERLALVSPAQERRSRGRVLVVGVAEVYHTDAVGLAASLREPGGRVGLR